MVRFHQKYVVGVVAVLLVAGCSTGDETSSGSGGRGGQNSESSRTSLDTSSLSGEMRSRLEEIGDRVYFENDKADLTPDGRALVQKWASWLTQYPGAKVTIEGHCDERGTREYNLALGERRAGAAKAYLVLIGADERRVSVVSYGKERPAELGSNEQAWAKNRRAVMVVE
ncbi:MAG TPA: peptidoglycan-associated lipoprotein Pal [Alphaproteobacteria bacterium]